MSKQIANLVAAIPENSDKQYSILFTGSSQVNTPPNRT